MSTWSRLFRELYNRIVVWLQTSSPATLQATGVLGLAFLVLGYFHIRGLFGPANDQRGRGSSRSGNATARANQHGGDGSRAAAASAGQVAAPEDSDRQAGTSKSAGAPSTSQPASAQGTSPLARSVCERLVGVKRVTISAPGVLLHEWLANDLQDAASVRPEAVQLVREVVRVATREVYLVAHVVDDIGQAAVSGALEAAGLLGVGAGQVPSHRLLFCSTLEGKVSIVRQLEPELHIDGHAATVEELRRFMPQLVHVYQSGGLAAQAAPNVGHATSLAAFFGV